LLPPFEYFHHASRSIASFFTPDSTTTRTTRKRTLNAGADTSDIHNNDTDSDDAGDATNASKRAKATPKKGAVKKATVKKTPAKTAGKKATVVKGSKTPAKLYKDTIAGVDKTSKILGKASADTDATVAAMHKTLPCVRISRLRYPDFDQECICAGLAHRRACCSGS